MLRGEAAGQQAVQGLRVDVQGPVELLAVPLAAPLQMAQEVAEPHAHRRLGVPELLCILVAEDLGVVAI